MRVVVAMEQKESAHFTQEKEGEAVTLKIRFAQFKEAVGTKEERSCECIKWFNIVLSVLLLVSYTLLFSFRSYPADSCQYLIEICL